MSNKDYNLIKLDNKTNDHDNAYEDSIEKHFRTELADNHDSDYENPTEKQVQSDLPGNQDYEFEGIGNTLEDYTESSPDEKKDRIFRFFDKKNLSAFFKKLSAFVVVVLILSGGYYSCKYAYEYKKKEERKIKRRKEREERNKIHIKHGIIELPPKDPVAREKYHKKRIEELNKISNPIVRKVFVDGEKRMLEELKEKNTKNID